MSFEVCGECTKPFSVYEYGLSMPGTKERESVDCPHCGNIVRTEISNGFFMTRALSPEEEIRWRQSQT